MASRSLGALAIVVITACLSGCDHARHRGGRVDPRIQGTLWSRGEAVFRLQNEQMDRLIAAEQLLGDDRHGRSAALFAAEDHIVANCQALNAAAGILAAGGSVGIDAKVRVLRSLPRCESAALAAKAMLEQDAKPVVVNLRRPAPG